MQEYEPFHQGSGQFSHALHFVAWTAHPIGLPLAARVREHGKPNDVAATPCNGRVFPGPGGDRGDYRTWPGPLGIFAFRATGRVTC